MTEPNTGEAPVDPRLRDWLEDERDAFLAYELGDFSAAITGWEALLRESATVSQLRSDPNGDTFIQEIETELAAARRQVEERAEADGK